MRYKHKMHFRFILLNFTITLEMLHVTQENAAKNISIHLKITLGRALRNRVLI